LKSQRRDEIEEFLAKTDDPNYWRTIYDSVNDRDVVLTDKQISILRRIQQGKLGEESDPNDYLLPLEDNKDWFHPISNAPAPKSRFIPSKWEARRIAYLVKAMRGGWIKLPEEERAEREKKKEKKFYMLWEDEELTKEQKKRKKMHIEAPKIKLPSHAESYNPPVEYLMSEEAIKRWNESHVEDRTRNFVPQKFNSMREVPRYKNDIKERFERCLDLYLCPREVKSRRKIKPEKLLPQLPKPQGIYYYFYFLLSFLFNYFIHFYYSIHFFFFVFFLFVVFHFFFKIFL
jgi:ribosome biogenesis protein ERB1